MRQDISQEAGNVGNFQDISTLNTSFWLQSNNKIIMLTNFLHLNVFGAKWHISKCNKTKLNSTCHQMPLISLLKRLNQSLNTKIHNNYIKNIIRISRSEKTTGNGLVMWLYIPFFANLKHDFFARVLFPSTCERSMSLVRKCLAASILFVCWSYHFFCV